MNIVEVLDEYFLSIDNNKDIEDGNYPKAKDLMNLIDDRSIWDELIARRFNTTRLQEYFSDLSQEERAHVFKFGISCFVHFVQANFTGPEIKEKTFDVPQTAKFFTERLALGNDEINPNTKFPHLLDISKCIFENCLVAKIANLLWTLRSLIIHQQIMDESSPVVLSLANDVRDQFETHILPDYIKAKFDLEFAQLYILLRHITKCNEHLDSAENKLDIKYNFGGKLGKRTRYQLEDLAQMTLEVSLPTDKPEYKPVHDFEVPKDIPLRDDVRLNKIQFVVPQEKGIDIPNTEQKFLLTRVQEMIIARPGTELVKEEILPFIDLILSQKNTWSVRVATLMLRGKYEDTLRTVNRKLSQCEEILQCYGKTSPHVLSRFADAFSTGLQPMWKIQYDYAYTLQSLGLVKEALNTYLKIQDWEAVIACYSLLGLQHKAAEIIQQQLDLKETPRLWCLLGAATNSISCYEKAWKLSEERSHMAQKSWGMHLYNRKKYEECIPHFQTSLSINPLQPSILIRVGYAALVTQNWQLAASAYLRFTHLQPEGFEAWNNLAQCYLKLDRKKEAHNALSEALKYNFENWKVWENYMIVSHELSMYTNVIQAYHKIMDLNPRYVNLEMLYQLSTKAVSNYDKFNQQTRELFGRVIATVDTDQYHVWKWYGILTPPGPLRAERFLKAYKGVTKLGWEKDKESCLDVLDICVLFCLLVLVNGIDLPMNILYSMRLNIKAALVAARKNDEKEVLETLETNAVLFQSTISKIDEIADKEQQKLANNGTS